MCFSSYFLELLVDRGSLQQFLYRRLKALQDNNSLWSVTGSVNSYISLLFFFLIRNVTSLSVVCYHVMIPFMLPLHSAWCISQDHLTCSFNGHKIHCFHCAWCNLTTCIVSYFSLSQYLSLFFFFLFFIHS